MAALMATMPPMEWATMKSGRVGWWRSWTAWNRVVKMS